MLYIVVISLYNNKIVNEKQRRDVRVIRKRETIKL